MSIESAKKVQAELAAIHQLFDGAVLRLDDVVAEMCLAAAGQRELPGIGGEESFSFSLAPAGERGLRDRIAELERERERQALQIARLVRENAELRAGRVAPGQAAD